MMRSTFRESASRSSREASTAACAATFMLYGILILRIVSETAGGNTPYPALNPASPAHLLNVRTTIRLSCSAVSETKLPPANSAYASSTTTAASWASSRSSASGGTALPVGLFGDETKASLALAANATSIASTSSAKSSRRGASTSLAPYVRATKSYIPNVGGAFSTASPGEMNSRPVRSSSSSEPLPTTIRSGSTLPYSATASPLWRCSGSG